MTAKKIAYVTAKDTNHVHAIQDAAVKAVNSARIKVQIALVATMLHIGKHGDYTLASRLVEGLGNTVNGKAIVEWFTTYCGLSVAEDGSGFDGIVKGHEKYIREHLEAAKEKMWWELKPSNPYKGFNADEALQKWLKDTKAAQEKLKSLPEAERGKINLHVNDATIQQVIAMVKFDSILKAEAKNDSNKVAAPAAA